MFSPKFLVNANEASKNVDVINENFRNIKVDLEYLNDLDKRISDIDARTKCVNPERIRRDYLLTKSELEAKANLAGGNTFSGKQKIAASSATEAGINYGGTGTAPSSPVDGDMWKTAVAFFVRIASTTYQLAMLSLAQTWSAVQTFSATPVISSITAATTAGAFYRITGRNPVFYEGMVRQLSAVFFRGSTATTVNSNSSTIVSMAVAQGTATVLANALGIRGSKLRVTVTAEVSVTGGVLYITVKIGNVEIATTLLTSPQVGFLNSITFEAVVVTAGASGVIHGGAYVSSAGSNSSYSSPASLNTTASNAITCTGLWRGVVGTASVSVLTAEII